MIRVLLAEDQAMVRGALSALLSREKDIEVVAEVARGDEVVQAALATQPDIALLDIEMPGSDGLTAAQALQKVLPNCRSVILTTVHGESPRFRYLRQMCRSASRASNPRRSSACGPLRYLATMRSAVPGRSDLDVPSGA